MEAGEIWAAETNGELRIRPRIFGGRLGVPKIRAYRGLFPWGPPPYFTSSGKAGLGGGEKA